MYFPTLKWLYWLIQEPKKIKADAEEELEEGECSADSSDHEDEINLTLETDDKLMDDIKCLPTIANTHENDLDNGRINYLFKYKYDLVFYIYLNHLHLYKYIGNFCWLSSLYI